VVKLRRKKEGRYMWFIGSKITKELKKEAERMGFEVQQVSLPRSVGKQSAKKFWENLLKEIPWVPGDAFVISGPPKWVAYIVQTVTISDCHLNGFWGDRYLPTALSPEIAKKYGADIENGVWLPAREIELYTVERGKLVKLLED
jgi:hypothetical protein